MGARQGSLDAYCGVTAANQKESQHMNFLQGLWPCKKFICWLSF